LEGKISMGRYTQGPCYIEICDNTHRRLINVTMSEEEFAKALTGLGDRKAKLTLYFKEAELPASDNKQNVPLEYEEWTVRQCANYDKCTVKNKNLHCYANKPCFI